MISTQSFDVLKFSLNALTYLRRLANPSEVTDPTDIFILFTDTDELSHIGHLK